MKDLMLALLLALILVPLVILVPIVVTIVFPIIAFALLVWVIWILLQIIKDEDPPDRG
jgi:hypothetical protein